MLAAALVTIILSAPPAEQAELLRTFHSEFVGIPPAGVPLPPKLGRFAIAKYETTQNLYRAVMGKNPSRWQGERNSVEMVSFHEANEFCEKATQLLRDAKLIGDKQEVRLPTADEWLFAARAGTTTKYSFGDDKSQLGEYAWSHENAAGNDPAVGAKKPNPWGIYDVHGYLWEWTATPDAAASTARILCGGSWKDTAENCASDSRRALPPDTRDDAIGFRCVLSEE